MLSLTAPSAGHRILAASLQVIAQIAASRWAQETDCEACKADVTPDNVISHL